MIFNVQSGEEGIKALVERFKGLIADNGVIDSEEDWGKRRLAYPIQDEIEGYYYKVNFTSGPDFPAELDRVYKITDGVLRTMIVRDETEPAKPEAPKAQAPAQEAAVTAPIVVDMPEITQE
jgi:small subunit ribosomal protein S6